MMSIDSRPCNDRLNPAFGVPFFRVRPNQNQSRDEEPPEHSSTTTTFDQSNPPEENVQHQLVSTAKEIQLKEKAIQEKERDIVLRDRFLQGLENELFHSEPFADSRMRQGEITRNPQDKRDHLGRRFEHQGHDFPDQNSNGGRLDNQAPFTPNPDELLHNICRVVKQESGLALMEHTVVKQERNEFEGADEQNAGAGEGADEQNAGADEGIEGADEGIEGADEGIEGAPDQNPRSKNYERILRHLYPDIEYKVRNIQLSRLS